jgi:hypothetical protein
MSTDISVVINPPNQIPVTIGAGITKHAPSHAPGASDSLEAYYVTGNVIRPSDTGQFLSAGATGSFVSTGATGNFITVSQTGQFVWTGATGNFVTGSVVRPSDTGKFITSGQTGALTGAFYPLSTNPSGYVQGAVVRPSNTGAFLDTGSNQTINALKNFLTRPTVNGTGVLLSGEAAANTGALTGSFYPLNSNPSGYITGVDLSNYVTKPAIPAGSFTNKFLTWGAFDWMPTSTSAARDLIMPGAPSPAQGSYAWSWNGDYYGWLYLGNFVTSSGTGSFVTTGQTGVFIDSSQTGQFVSIDSTGEFITTDQTGQFVGTGETGSLTQAFYPLNENPAGYINYLPSPGLTLEEAENYFYPLNSNPSGYLITIPTGVYLTYDEAVTYFYPLESNPSGYATGDVVRPSETGAFITTGQTGQFVWTGATGNFVTGSVVRPSETGSFVVTGQTGSFLTSGSPIEIVQVYGKNDEAFTLYKGQPVYIGGANGSNPLFKLASNTGESTSSQTIGLLSQNLNADDLGYAITEGGLQGLDTSLGTAGDPMWLGPTGNILYGTGNKPYGNNHLVYLGVVLRSQLNNGKVYVKVQNGFEINELHKVYAQNPIDNSTLLYNSGSGSWFARQINTGDVSGISAYALASNTGSFVTTAQTGQFISTGSTGTFVASSSTGAFLTTGAADGRYYGLTNGQSISGYAFTGYNNSVTGMSITGTSIKYITLFQIGGTIVTGSFIDSSGSSSGSGSINVNDSNLIISTSMFA